MTFLQIIAVLKVFGPAPAGERQNGELDGVVELVGELRRGLFFDDRKSIGPLIGIEFKKRKGICHSGCDASKGHKTDAPHRRNGYLENIVSGNR